MDILQLEESVSGFLAKALAPSTLRTYGAGQRRFMTFCNAAGVSPLPVSEQSLCMFVAWLAKDGLTHQTIKSYLSAVRHFHILARYGDPFAGDPFPILQYVLRGIKRTPTQTARQPRLPITPQILRILKQRWQTTAANDSDYIMFWAACCMGFFGFMRAGEFVLPHRSEFDPAVSLCWEDVAVDSYHNPSMIQINLKQSKTDPFRKGISIYLGRTNTELCPVAAILAYMAVRPPGQGPFFLLKDGSYLIRDKLVAVIRRTLEEAGLDTKGFTGHSFRIGAATTAASAGIEDSVIKMLGRWESSAYQRYLRTPRESLAAVSVRLVQ